MIDINDLTNEQLARAVDLYLFRIFSEVKAQEQLKDEYLYLSISTECRNTSIVVNHVITLGYDNEQKIKCGNLFEAMDTIRERLETEKPSMPKEMTIALPAPKHDDYAEYEDAK